MAKHKPRRRKSLNPPSTNIPHRLHDPNVFESTYFRWRATDEYIDYDDDEWGWGQATIQDFFQKILPRLQEYENWTWSEIFKRKSCHYWDINDIPTKARNKLKKKYPQHDTFHQIDVEQPCRLLGWRDRHTLFLIWYDPNHTICPQ
jgi:hypothetical protein